MFLSCEPTVWPASRKITRSYFQQHFFEISSERGETKSRQLQAKSTTRCDGDIPLLVRDEEGNRSYRRGAFLGKGSSARVYAAKDTATGNMCALKVVRGHRRRAQVWLLLTHQNEAVLHATLEHSHVVPLWRHFSDANCDYLVLELCGDGSLAELLERRQRVSEAEARYFLRQILSALDYVRRKGLVHRDVKLSNLFLHNMVVKLGDFGLACRFHTAEQHLWGTPSYVAPEVLLGAAASHKSDVWAAGIVLYALLLGETPFADADITSTYERIVSHSYAFPPEPALAAKSKQFVATLLSVNTLERPSAEEAFSHAWFALWTPEALPKRALRHSIYSS